MLGLFFGCVLTGGGGVAVSNNGATWVTAKPAGIYGLWDVAYNGTQWVAAGYARTIATSNNGTIWIKQNAGAGSEDLYTAQWNGSGAYFVGGASGTVLTSGNGTAWQAFSTRLTDVPLNDMIWAGDKAIAVGGYYPFAGLETAILTSPDGITWTGKSLPNNVSAISKFASTEKTLFASARESGRGPNILLESPDGVTWKKVAAIPLVDDVSALTWTGTRLLISGYSNIVISE